MAHAFAAWPWVRRHKRPAADARKVLLNRHRSLLRRADVEARKVLLNRHCSLLRRADVEARPALASRPPAARHEPSFSGDDLVLWQVLHTSASSWRSIRYTGSDPWFPGGRGRFRTSGLCRVNESAQAHGPSHDLPPHYRTAGQRCGVALMCDVSRGVVRPAC
jgi:hypothetical protein